MMKKIDSWLGSEQIIVLVGQRRVGKSYVMKEFISRHEKEADATIIYKELVPMHPLQWYRSADIIKGSSRYSILAIVTSSNSLI